MNLLVDRFPEFRSIAESAGIQVISIAELRQQEAQALKEINEATAANQHLNGTDQYGNKLQQQQDSSQQSTNIENSAGAKLTGLTTNLLTSVGLPIPKQLKQKQRKIDEAIKLKEKAKERKAGGSYMTRLFSDVQNIQKLINEVQECTEGIDGCTDELLQATTMEQEKGAEEKMEELVQKGSGSLKQGKALFEQMIEKDYAEGLQGREKAKQEKEKQEKEKNSGDTQQQQQYDEQGNPIPQDQDDHNDDPNNPNKTTQKDTLATPSELRMKTNMTNALARKLQLSVSQFQQAQSAFSRELKEKTRRQLRICCPEYDLQTGQAITEQDIEQMIENGENRNTVVQRQMQGSHAMLLESLERVHDKYQGVRRLERSMGELYQMFLDMSQLIEHQGEILDVIEVNVSKTKSYTKEAEKELITARKAQYSAHKRMCCITAVMLIIVCVVIFPILFGQGAIR